MSNKELSILICHLPERKNLLNKLLDRLNPQLKDTVEILVDDGDGAIGTKRNRLMEKSIGKYVAFIDDDDMVSEDYVHLILNNTGIGFDCIGIQGEITVKGKLWKFRHSITVSKWCKDRENRIYFRTPNHLNPIKRDLALQTMFPETSWGEDKDYSDRIKSLLNTEKFIEKTIYYYQR